MRSNWKVNLLLFWGVVVIGLVFSEIALRLLGFNPAPSRSDLFVPDDTLGWTGQPNYQAQLQESDVQFSVEMNRWGFRDDQPPPFDQVESKHRLLYLGDSFIMGSGVSKEARASEIVARTDTSFYGYNFGLLGYSTDQELLVLKKFGPELKPEVVLLFFCANDLLFNDSDFGHRKPKPHFYLQQDGSLILKNVPVPRLEQEILWLERLSNFSSLGRLLFVVSERFAFKQRTERHKIARESEFESVGRGEVNTDSLLLFSETASSSDLTYYLLRDLKSECSRLGSSLMVFTVPSNHHWTATHSDTPREMQRVMGWCADLGVRCVDLFPYFYQDFQQNRQTLYIADKMHWNERGHQVVAQVILETLKDSN